MLDILLINPPQENVYGRGVLPPYPPLGLLYVGAVLKERGFSVEVIDSTIDFSQERALLSYVRERNPLIVGFTAVTPTIDSVLRLSRSIKRFSESLIVIGGPHASAVPHEVLKSQDIDGVVIGEAEESFVQFMDHVKSGELHPVDGMIIRRDSALLQGRPRDFIGNLDSLPFPDWSLVKNWERYSPPDALRTPVATILTSRGCPYRCTFCLTPTIWGRKIRRRSIRNVVEEIEMLIRRYGVKEIHIADDDFTHEREWTLSFLREVRRRMWSLRFFFMNGLRIDNVDREILKELRETRFVNVGFGIESGSQRILNNIKKGLRIDEIEEKFAMVKEMGFKTWGFFIFGLPGETRWTMKETFDFSLTLEPDFAKYLYLVPYPGTEVCEEFQKKGYLKTNEYSRYGIYSEPVYELPSVGSHEITRELHHAYLKFYLRPTKILKILFKIRTLTELKLNVRAIFFLLRKIIGIRI
jgi:anaerobic magnesium-protoporphyrin IX monomethyl ester cyclase